MTLEELQKVSGNIKNVTAGINSKRGAAYDLEKYEHLWIDSGSNKIALNILENNYNATELTPIIKKELLIINPINIQHIYLLIKM